MEIMASRIPEGEARIEGASERDLDETRQARHELAVPLSKWKIVVQLAVTYTLIVGVVLALFFLAYDVGKWASFGILALTLPYVLWGATLLYEDRPVVVVDAGIGMSIHHSALVGEKFVPLGPVFGVPWQTIMRWEVQPVMLPFGIPTGVSRLKVYLRDTEAFVRSQGFVCGRLRFLLRSLFFGTPLVLSDLLLSVKVETIAEFMNGAVQTRRNEGLNECDERPRLVRTPIVLIQE